jgi:hypothetical protein
MHEEDKPFVCYYRSWWNFNIWPRKLFGWVAMLLWSLPAFALFLGYHRLAQSTNSDAVLWGMTIGLVLLLLLWQQAMTRWMKARAQMIKVD